MTWPEIIIGINCDEIASKLHFKNVKDFNLTKGQHVPIFHALKIKDINFMVMACTSPN